MRWILIGTCLVLGAVTAAQWWLWPALPPDPEAASVNQEQAQEPILPDSIPRYRLPARSVYQEIDKRPLFLEGRQPPATVKLTGTKQSPTDEPLPSHLGLTAILTTKDGTLALIEDKKEQQFLRVEKGADLAGWQIVSILPDRLILSQGEKRQEMLLREFRNVPLPATSATQPPSGSPAPNARKTTKSQPRKTQPRKAMAKKGTPQRPTSRRKK